MSKDISGVGWGRRSFLSRFGLGAAAIGAGVVATPSAAGGQAAAGAQAAGGTSPWQPARHADDDWFDAPSAKHRVFFDTTTADAIGRAIFFANNLYAANRSSYGLTDADTSLVICVRHESTAFGYNDAMWKKYPTALAERSNFTDPQTKAPAIVNVYQTAGYPSLNNSGVLLDAVIRRGMRLAVCALATRATASVIARGTGGKLDDIFKELTENLVPNAHMVPAGIVAVNRAQERGYTFTYVAG
jgi:hypothetical protein